MGKQKLIDVLYNLFQRELPHDETESKCVKISFTGMASANIDGRTWHSFLGLGKGHGKIDGLKDMKAVSKATTRDRLKSVQVIIEDEKVILDMSNAPAQQNGPINCPLPSTVSKARVAFSMMAGNGEQPNEGFFRPLVIKTKKGGYKYVQSNR